MQRRGRCDIHRQDEVTAELEAVVDSAPVGKETLRMTC
jgi:hypothetical protein